MTEGPRIRALRDPGLRRRAERFWARRLDCSEDCFRTPGLQLVTHPLAGRVFVVALEESVVVAAPAGMHGVLEARDPVSLLEPATLPTCLPAGAVFVGPAFVGYAASPAGRPTGVEALPHARVRDLAAIREAVSPSDWRNANLEAADAPLWGARVDGRVVAAAGAQRLLEEVAHIGVVTHPDYRGRGLARRVVTAVAAESASLGLLLQYQTLCANTPALAVAASLGFERFARTLSARLPAVP